jgi:LacI family transcriptional regulator
MPQILSKSVRKRDVSIRDIASGAGVSITTVSRILNQDGALKITPQTRERVLETARALGYQPNFIAAALRSNRTGILGALSPNLAGTFLPLLTQELLRAARAQGVELLVGTPELDEEHIAAQLKKLQSLLFDGLLLLGDVLDYQTTIRKLQVMKKPYLSVCAGVNVPPPFVNMDDEQATALAIEYLVGLGHRRIGYLGSRQWNQEHYRVVYFRVMMARHGLPVPDDYVALMEHAPYVPFDPKFRAMWTVEPLRAAQRLLHMPQPPTAILCANDGFAIAAMKSASQAGVRVPEDVSIMGYNDEIQSTLFTPELTTIRQPVDLIASAAVSLLLAMIEHGTSGEYAETRHLIAPELVVRGSCAPPRNR